MKYEKCLICGEYGWESHKCNPQFVVFRDEDDLWGAINYSGDPRTIRATDEESAAVRYCESDYENPNEMEVLVISLEKWYNLTEDVNDETDVDALTKVVTSNCKRFEMESEIVRNFYAKEI